MQAAYWCGVTLWDKGECNEQRVHIHRDIGIVFTAAHVAELARRSAEQFVREWNGDGHLSGVDLDYFQKEVLRAHVGLLHDALGVAAVAPTWGGA